MNESLSTTARALFGAVLGVLLAHPVAAAETGPQADLKATIGEPASAVLELLGPPLLQTPAELWYSREPRVEGGRPRIPQTAVSSGRNGVVVEGAGGDYAPLTFSREACDLSIRLSTGGTVTAIEQSGPGCFEFIHELARTRDRDSAAD